MNQAELNRIALNVICDHSDEVFVKLQKLLTDDAKERSEEISGRPLHHIHNKGLFNCLVWLNSFYPLG